MMNTTELSTPKIITAHFHRSRLSLDLSSPTTNTANDHSNNKLVHTPTTLSSVIIATSTKSPSVTKLNTPTSPMAANSVLFASSRYTEFKTYSSTFDGLQALENHNNTPVVTNLNGQQRVPPQMNASPSSTDNNPLMRVSSLPAIPPQNQLTGKLLMHRVVRFHLPILLSTSSDDDAIYELNES